VIVIHDINFAACYSDYIVALKDGKVVKEGLTTEVITPEVLKEIYDMDFTVREENKRRYCLYYA